MENFEKRIDDIFNKDIVLDEDGANRLLEIFANGDKKINYKDIDVIEEMKESTKWLKKYIDDTRGIIKDDEG